MGSRGGGGDVYEGDLGPIAAREPSFSPAALLAALTFLLLLVNGRPIPRPAARATQQMAVSLAQTGTRGTEAGASVAAAFAAAPVFVAARTVFALDEAGAAMASKLAA